MSNPIDSYKDYLRKATRRGDITVEEVHAKRLSKEVAYCYGCTDKDLKEISNESLQYN